MSACTVSPPACLPPPASAIPYARIDSILDLSRAFSSTMGLAVNAESMLGWSGLAVSWEKETVHVAARSLLRAWGERALGAVAVAGRRASWLVVGPPMSSRARAPTCSAGISSSSSHHRASQRALSSNEKYQKQMASLSMHPYSVQDHIDGNESVF